MTNLPRTARILCGALYTWSAAVFFGALLLDVVYSSQLDNINASLVRSVYNEVSDFLLILAGFALLAGFTAIAASWHVASARNLFAVSLLVILVSEFLIPIFMFPFLKTLSGSSILAIPHFIRLIPIAVASLLAQTSFRYLFNE